MKRILTLTTMLTLPAATLHAQEGAVLEYLKAAPYQETYDYMMGLTGGDPAKINTWAFGEEPVIPKAGTDDIVRMNNDTFYKFAFADLTKGPVTLTSAVSDPERFSSYQLMDDRNVNFHNVIRPEGTVVLYRGDAPEGVEGELVEAPSDLVAVIVRVEIKDVQDEADVAKAEEVFRGIGISGPSFDAIPEVDLLSGFDPRIEEEAMALMQEAFSSQPFSDLVAGPEDVPDKVSFLQLAAGTVFGWGGPVVSHSAYEVMFESADGDQLIGSEGPWIITTEEPPVDAFWSVTAYDSDIDRFFDNPDDRYHFNNTTAVKNDDGTVTFTFSTDCGADDLNCLYVPEGQFDITTRYYLPDEAIQSGEWTMPRPVKAN